MSQENVSSIQRTIARNLNYRQELWSSQHVAAMNIVLTGPVLLCCLAAVYNLSLIEFL